MGGADEIGEPGSLSVPANPSLSESCRHRKRLAGIHVLTYLLINEAECCVQDVTGWKMIVLSYYLTDYWP